MDGSSFTSPTLTAMEVLKHDSAFDDGDLKDLGDDTIVVTSEQAAQFSSIVNIGAMVGALIAGVACDVLGRRSTILLVAPVFAGMWIWTAMTTSYAQLIVARVTTGVAVGVVSMATPLYISETAPTNLRGSLGSVNQVREVAVHPIIFFQYLCNPIALKTRGNGENSTPPHSI